jgi:hypothetical protein
VAFGVYIEADALNYKKERLIMILDVILGVIISVIILRYWKEIVTYGALGLITIFAFIIGGIAFLKYDPLYFDVFVILLIIFLPVIALSKIIGYGKRFGSLSNGFKYYQIKISPYFNDDQFIEKQKKLVKFHELEKEISERKRKLSIKFGKEKTDQLHEYISQYLEKYKAEYDVKIIKGSNQIIIKIKDKVIAVVEIGVFVKTEKKVDIFVSYRAINQWGELPPHFPMKNANYLNDKKGAKLVKNTIRQYILTNQERMPFPNDL